MIRMFEFERNAQESCVNFCSRTTRFGRIIWKNRGYIFSEIKAESVWRTMGCVCVGRDRLRYWQLLGFVFKWRSTCWWKNMKASIMMVDPNNHTRWKHQYRGIIEDLLRTTERQNGQETGSGQKRRKDARTTWI